MQKHLFTYAWLFAGLILSIAACLAIIAWMLLQPTAPDARLLTNVHFVQEVFCHAAI